MVMTEEHRLYLNELRRSGIVNMFGAPPYLAEAFSISKQESREVVSQWMKQFKEEDR